MALITVSEVADGVARITLNRPEKRNALSREMRDQLLDVLDRLGADEGVRVLVITGAGPVFCAGFDLTEMAAATPVDPGRTAASDPSTMPSSASRFRWWRRSTARPSAEDSTWPS